MGLTSGGADGGYQTPMKGDLLWVYEGLTNYLGEILAPRSGLLSQEDFRESLAAEAAALDTKYGRTWRPLEDTAVAAQTLYEAGSDYADYRRTVDYYAEGTLIWLDADVSIRQLSRGARPEFFKAEEGERKTIDLSYSLGLKIREDGTVIDIAYAGPAQKAGIPPAVTIVAVNNRQFTPTVLHEAVEATASATKPLELLIKTGEYYETHRIDYRGGERYPHLVRDPAVPDLLSEILKPLVVR
jgi:predicted metalloprotease with PDZ domain